MAVTRGNSVESWSVVNRGPQRTGDSDQFPLGSIFMDNIEELKRHASGFKKMSNIKAPSLVQQKKICRTNKRLHVEVKEEEEDIQNMHAEKIAKLEAEVELLQRENNALREKLQKKDAGIIHVLNLLERSTTELSNTIYPQSTVPSSVHTSHTTSKIINTLASKRPTKKTSESFDLSASHLAPSISILSEPTCFLSTPKWKIPTYPDGSSRMQLISGYNVFIDHVKYYACNKKRGTNKFVSDLLLALVGDRGYLSKVSVSGKNSNAHANKVAKPKICEDLLDAVIACVSQLMDVSSKEVRTAIKSRLNIASKLEKSRAT